MKINKLLTRLKRLKSASRKNVYRIGAIELDTPENYGNIEFQNKFKLYDRFLPVLAEVISSNDLIIDVGANIGDTTIAIVQKCINPIVAIEPSEIFLPYLEKNFSKLPENQKNRIEVIKKLIGTGCISGNLSHNEWGTASVNSNTDSKQETHTALDACIKKLSNVILLKSDTDGFDFDVIKSAEKLIDQSKPILFWENEIRQEFQSKGFDELYEWLETKGYEYIYVFDNFGNLLTIEKNFSTLKNLNAYIYTMDVNNCKRTIYYTDILACTNKNKDLVSKAIEKYKNEWILK